MNVFKKIHDMNWEVAGELIWNDPIFSSHVLVKGHFTPQIIMSLYIQYIHTHTEQPTNPRDQVLNNPIRHQTWEGVGERKDINKAH